MGRRLTEAQRTGLKARWPKRSVIERFWSKTKVEGSCILWVGATENGYGVFGYSGQKTARAHRWLYQRVLGRLPSSIDVMHSCDNRRCVALQHLSPGTRKMNMVDAVNKGRTHRGERIPSSKLTEEQVREIRLRRTTGETFQSIADSYGVDPPCIYKIVTRQTWRHVR